MSRPVDSSASSRKRSGGVRGGKCFDRGRDLRQACLADEHAVDSRDQYSPKQSINAPPPTRHWMREARDGQLPRRLAQRRLKVGRKQAGIRGCRHEHYTQARVAACGEGEGTSMWNGEAGCWTLDGSQAGVSGCRHEHDAQAGVASCGGAGKWQHTAVAGHDLGLKGGCRANTRASTVAGMCNGPQARMGPYPTQAAHQQHARQLHLQ